MRKKLALLALPIFFGSAVVYAADTTIKGTTATSAVASLEVTNSADASLLFVRNDGNVGVGDTTPASLFTVANGDLFQVNSSGDVIKLKNVTYAWPSSQGAVNTYLKNDGSGGLSWATAAAGSSALSALTDAAGPNTLSNGSNAQAWNWALGATGNTAFTLGEGTAASSGGAILNVKTLATSTAVPLTVDNSGSANSFVIKNLGAGTTELVVTNAGNLGVGDNLTPLAKQEIVSTTEQLRLSNVHGVSDSRFTVDGSGNLTIDNTGTKSIIADDLQVSGNHVLDSAAATRLTLGATNTATGNLAATGTLSSGTASTTTGAVTLANSTNANTITIQSGATGTTHTLTLPATQGAANTFLKNDGAGALTWSSTSSTLAFSTKTSNYTITGSDDVIAADASGGGITITLPTAAGISGRKFSVKRTNSGNNNVTVATTGGQTIDGDSTQVLVLQYTSIDVVSDGSNWNIV